VVGQCQQGLIVINPRSVLWKRLNPPSTFDGDERPAYVASLVSVTEHDGTLYVLCFSDEGADTGPHPISRGELRAAFNANSGWNVAAIEADRVLTRFHGDNGAPAWLATIKRI